MQPSTARLTLHKLLRIARQKLRIVRGIDRRQVTIEPSGDPLGRVLLSYIIDPYLLPVGAPLTHDHTHDWESLAIGRTFVEMGYTVDVISWANNRFLPDRDYRLFIDARYNLERIAHRLGDGCSKVMHIDTAHCDFHNQAELDRLGALEERRGIRLRPRRLMPPNRGIEHADCGTVLGNEFTIGTYRYANKPLLRVPISVPVVYPWPERKDFAAARRRFLWFGSGGMVHKGLDIVLEAFAATPELELVVCGPVENELDFVRAYARELYHTANIRLHGWIDVASPAFTELAASCVGVVYPSASEGGGGCVITCMHAGLIPIVTHEASVDVTPERGVLLDGASVEGLQVAVQRLASQSPEALGEQARSAWEHVRAHHTRERFAEEYRAAAEGILGGGALLQ